MKLELTIFSTVVLALLTAVPPRVRAQSPTPDASQTPSAPPNEMQSGPQGAPVAGAGRGRGVFGKITAIQKDAIEVARPDGTKVSVKLTAATEFRKEREAAKLADFKVGDSVMVRTDRQAGQSDDATAVTVASVPAGFAGRRRGGPGAPGMMPGTMGKDFVAGEVKSLDPPKLMVLRMDGVTQTLELNEETSLRRGRESLTMADIQPGDHIFARGAVANDVFVPKSISVIPPEQWKRIEEMDSQGEGAGAPQGAPAEAASPKPPEQPN